MRTHLLPLSFLVLLVACGDDDASTPTDEPGTTAELDCAEAYDTYAPGLQKPGVDYRFTMLSADPDPPDRGDNTWEVEVTDASGAPVLGLPLVVEPYMPEHGHGTSPKTFAATEVGDGIYRFTDINLFMPGLWQLFVWIDDGRSDGGTDADPMTSEQGEFRFCLEG